MEKEKKEYKKPVLKKINNPERAIQIAKRIEELRKELKALVDNNKDQ